MNKITADTITAEQIRELRSQLFDEGYTDTTYIDACYTALAIVGDFYWWRDNVTDIVTTDEHRAARARCAEILNARAEGK